MFTCDGRQEDGRAWGRLINSMFELVLWWKLFLRLCGSLCWCYRTTLEPFLMAWVCDVSLPPSRLEEGREQWTDAFNVEKQACCWRCRWEIRATTAASLFPECTVPLSPKNARHEGRWLSRSSHLTRFPQPPLQLSIVAFQAAWCYFTIVGVSVSSRILQCFVAYRYWGFVVHFNS